MDGFQKSVRIELLKIDKNQKWLAQQLGVKEGQLSEMLNGKRQGKKTKSYRIRIAEMLGIKKLL